MLRSPHSSRAVGGSAGKVSEGAGCHIPDCQVMPPADHMLKSTLVLTAQSMHICHETSGKTEHPETAGVLMHACRLQINYCRQGAVKDLHGIKTVCLCGQGWHTRAVETLWCHGVDIGVSDGSECREGASCDTKLITMLCKGGGMEGNSSSTCR